VDAYRVGNDASGEEGPVEVVMSRAFPDDLVVLLGRRRSVMPESGREMSHDEIMGLVAAARALIVTSGVAIDEALLNAAPRLQIVATAAVGYDNIDIAAASRRGIWVSNTPDVVTEATADLALLLLLAILRRAGEGFELVKHGDWRTPNPDALWGDDPRDLTLGILGMGRIGKALARRVRALGMPVIYHNRTRLAPEVEATVEATWVSRDDLIHQADVISIHVPLSPSTRGMIGRAEFVAMRPGAILVNTARGAIVDEHALIEALTSGRLGGVGLDVFADEPRVPLALRRHPRAFLLPHVGTATAGTRRAMFKLAIDNVIEVLAGRPPLTPVGTRPIGGDASASGPARTSPARRPG
jgi:lactate dehydrogenase-like 2-hydroxyacid dehydrogenase